MCGGELLALHLLDPGGVGLRIGLDARPAGLGDGADGHARRQPRGQALNDDDVERRAQRLGDGGAGDDAPLRNGEDDGVGIAVAGKRRGQRETGVMSGCEDRVHACKTMRAGGRAL